MVSRRKFISGIALSAPGILMGERLKTVTDINDIEIKQDTSSGRQIDLMIEVMKLRKIETHAHIYWTKDSTGTQLDFGTRLGIDKQVISRYLDVMPGTPDQFRKFNDLTIKAMK